MVSIISAMHEYIVTVLSKVTGMKVLLVDSETVGIVSMVLSQTQILEHEVFLVEVFDKSSSDDTGGTASLKHLKAVAILRPSTANFLLLNRELKSPRFSEYSLCTFL